jgi:hypothetical protein
MSLPQPQPFRTTTNVHAHKFTYGPDLGLQDLSGTYRSYLFASDGIFILADEILLEPKLHSLFHLRYHNIT